jgi:hypothetical protein
MLRILMIPLLIVAVGACADISRENPGESTAAQELSDCQTDGCPKNSPVIATFPFHDLISKSTVPNAQGFTIQRFLINGTGYELKVSHGQISGSLGNTVVTGRALAGAQLWLQRGGTDYVLRITSVENVPMWAKLPGQPAPEIEAYRIDWSNVVRGQPTGWENVCAAATLPSDSPELNGVANYLTFVFEGEHIDAAAKVIIPPIEPQRFNLGCAGHLLMKMYLMGHVEAATWLGYVTTIDQRQTIMKMFAADYCAKGYAFTVPGILLQWQDDKAWVQYPGVGRPPSLARLDIEARWTPTGASCLTAPRVAAHGTPASNALWPLGIDAEINARCGMARPPACKDIDIQDFDGYHLVTANP